MKNVFIMDSGSKLYLAKKGGYTQSLKDARVWKTTSGAVKFFQQGLIRWNPRACLITIE